MLQSASILAGTGPSSFRVSPIRQGVEVREHDDAGLSEPAIGADVLPERGDLRQVVASHMGREFSGNPRCERVSRTWTGTTSVRSWWEVSNTIMLESFTPAPVSGLKCCYRAIEECSRARCAPQFRKEPHCLGGDVRDVEHPRREGITER